MKITKPKMSFFKWLELRRKPKHVYYNIDKNILVLVNHDGIIIAPKYPADKSGTYFYVGKP